MLPSYASKGAMSGIATSGATHNVPCPAIVTAGQLLIAHLMYENVAIAPTTPSGWTLLHGPEGTTGRRIWVFGRIADGTEDGSNIDFGTGTPASANNRYGIIYSFNDVRSDTIANIVGDFSTSEVSSNTLADQSVTTPEADCLAVNLVGIQDDRVIDAFTGMTGGTWAEASAEDTSSAFTPDQTMQIQVADMPSAGTIDGGTTSAGGASTPWNVTGFYIRGTVSAPLSDTDNFFAFS